MSRSRSRIRQNGSSKRDQSDRHNPFRKQDKDDAQMPAPKDWNGEKVERWPNDKFDENNRPGPSNPFGRNQREPAHDGYGGHFDDGRGERGGRPRRGLGYDREKKQQQHRPFEDDLLDTRRTKREMIGKAGTASVWGKTPPHPELSSDDENNLNKEKKKLKKKRKKEEKKAKKMKKSKKSKKTKKTKKTKKKKKESSSSDSDSSDESSGDGEPGEEVWVEKSDADKFKKPSTSKSSKSKRSKDDGDDESQIGPAVRNTSSLSHKDFGHALLPGEGAAMVSTKNTHRERNSGVMTELDVFHSSFFRLHTSPKVNVSHAEVKSA